jgi:hypothetical protein
MGKLWEYSSKVVLLQLILYAFFEFNAARPDIVVIVEVLTHFWD